MQKVIYVVSCITLIVFMTYKAGELVRPVDTDIAFNTIRTFYNLPEESMEVMVYGSSVAWRGLDVMEMYEGYGIGAYNFACNWQHINTTSLFIKESLKTQNPKVILIETYRINQFLSDTDINGEIYYTRGLKESKERREYLNDVFGKESKSRLVSYYVPLYAFHENWGEIDARNFMKDSSNYDFLKSMGYMKIDGCTKTTLGDSEEFQQSQLSSGAIKVLDDIVKTCKEKEIEIVFFTIPMQEEFVYADAMHKYAKENECTYLNLYDEIEMIGLDGDTDFCDTAHLNSNGAGKVASYLGKYLSENYQLTDMRQIKGNMWERKNNYETVFN